jgi:fermentation-respiration switch protein FrsA (DUF1100 family)
MADRRLAAGVMLAIGVALLLLAWHFLPESSSALESSRWTVSEAGLLDYSVSPPQYNASPAIDGLSEIRFQSRGAEIAALLRFPQSPAAGENATDGGAKNEKGIAGIVLLPGAGISKEQEQGFAEKLAALGYATITLDQRNLGSVDFQADLQAFLQGVEPVEHKMVYDALAAAEVLRGMQEIDPERIIYAGESNGGRFAITACALDSRAKGVLAISTCGYDTKTAIARAAAAGQAADPEVVRFYISIDPESYLDKIAPRPLVMIHSRNDTIIPYQMAENTFSRAAEPKRMRTVNCTVHGYCPEMAQALEEELVEISQG